MTEIVKGVKGFRRDMTCRGFQFEEGKTYKHEGEVKACTSGFHFCENPIDTFAYYSPGDSVFREVSGSGSVSRHDDDSKIAVSELTVGAEISLHDLIDLGIKFLFSREYTEEKSSNSTGDCSASSSTGDYSASSSTGDYSASSSTGDYSTAVCTGFKPKGMAGKYGCIALAWWNEKKERGEMRCAETGCGDGSDGKLKSEVWYVLNDKGEFVEESK